MPKRTASCCWSRLLKWCATIGWRSDSSASMATGASGENFVGMPVRAVVARRGFHVLIAARQGVFVGAGGHDRQFVEVVLRRRRRRLPFQAGRPPRVRPGILAEE